MSWRSFGADYFDYNDNKMAFVDTVLKTGLLHGLLDKYGEKNSHLYCCFINFRHFCSKVCVLNGFKTTHNALDFEVA